MPYTSAKRRFSGPPDATFRNPSMHSMTRWLAGLLAVLLLSCPNVFAQSRFVTLGHVDLSFYEVTATVVQSVLERMGYNVAVKKGSHAEIYPLLGKAEVDLFVADWIAGFEDNIAAQRWFVMPLWQPQYLNRVARMRVLEEPKQLLGGADKAYLVAHKDFYAKADKRTWKALQRISLSVTSVTEMDYLVNVKKLSPQYAVRNWMAAHPDTVNY